MKLKLNFVTKKPKLSIKNELIFVKNKNFRIGRLNTIEILNNELFKEKKISQINDNSSNYILVNCIDINKTSDFENLGSKLFDFLTENKIKNTFFNLNIQKITDLQIERILHGATLKSYSFEVYKTKKK